MKSNNKRVLLVDDEKMIRESVSEFLKELGCEIETAENDITLAIFEFKGKGETK